ncbi:class I SAM-dependent methyltransferase [Dethiobacter alkaliphilus]|uniref:class I SAM-dependent methyltransferase n=1 Tax=Dethiobacter alkaliphilus TaxID=427926 RepID=UPI00222721F6|nr:class I SAM-dependent methyltransferase [Dethiobacter alkaliphilus]MCW3489260.1 class I SAM-dependent methyltransferase [Dethiobacter alkaliphilus]
MHRRNWHYKGKSTCWLASGSKSGNKAPVFAIDIWDLKKQSDPRYERMRKKSGYNHSRILEIFCKQIKKAGVEQLITPIKTESHIIGEARLRPVGLLFIDGNHTFESCNRDYSVWSKHVVKGGFIAFHDSSLPGVEKVISEIAQPDEKWNDWQKTESLTVATRSLS